MMMKCALLITKCRHKIMNPEKAEYGKMIYLMKAEYEK
jgi:hypothetical protein